MVMVEVRRGGVVTGRFDLAVSRVGGAMSVLLGGSTFALARDSGGYYVDVAPVVVIPEEADFATKLAQVQTEAQSNADALPAGAEKTAWLGVVSDLESASLQIP
jgi:phosphatidate phosphatase APP1